VYTPLNPNDIKVDSFETTMPSLSSSGGMSEPPMICSCFGTCDFDCGTMQQQAL